MWNNFNSTSVANSIGEVFLIFMVVLEILTGKVISLWRFVSQEETSISLLYYSKLFVEFNKK